jgi:hypothetical protein
MWLLIDAQRHYRVNFPRSVAGKMASPVRLILEGNGAAEVNP